MFATITTIIAYEHVKQNYNKYYEWLIKCYDLISTAKSKLDTVKKEKDLEKDFENDFDDDI